MRKLKRLVSIVLAVMFVFSMLFSNNAENPGNGTASQEEIMSSEAMVLSSNYVDDEAEEEIIETTKEKIFIEETSVGLNINEYEKAELKMFIEEESAGFDNEESESDESIKTNVLENLVADIVLEKVESSSEIIVKEKETTNVVELEGIDISTSSDIENVKVNFDVEENEVDVATLSEASLLEVVSELNNGLFGAGNHTSTASPSVVINSAYDRYEIYTGENAGTVRIFDDNGVYFNGNTNVKVIRDMMDTNNNSPILLNLSNNVQFFEFDNSNDNYVLLPNGFVEDLIARYSGNGYLNPQGINALDHIKVDLTFNNTNLGSYDLFEYGVLYYLSCYEGVLGEYYYYDPNTTDINRATSFYVNNRIMDRTYNIVSEYFYKSPSGESLSFKPTWLINNDNLVGANKEDYAKQWVNFPYFLIKAGEKYWNLRDSIEQSTYLTEYAEGYYEQYLTEQPYGNVAERLTILDNIYKTEADLLNDNTSTVAVHPYVKSTAIEISGNFRADTINDVNKLRAGGVLPYDTYTVLNLKVTEHRAKSVQVYLNGEKLITNNNHGLYSLANGKCQIRIDGSKLLDEENSRNVISFILLNEEGNYLTDAQGRVINNYISLIRNSSVNKRTYTISFNTNGGSYLPNINVEEGNKISLPSNPIKNNFVFQGWFNDPNFQNRFDSNEYITGGKTLYALWGQSIPNPSRGGGYSGGGGGGGGGGRGAGLPAGTTTNNMLNPLSAAANANVSANVPNITNAVAVRGNWFTTNNKWQFSDENGNDYKDTWAFIDVSNNPMSQNADWYRFDENGNIMTGYYYVEDRIYYFNDGIKNKNDEGKMLIGWHWLPSPDGGYACYYFDANNENLGVLVTNGLADDGYCVDALGRWCDNGQVQKRSYR